MPVSQTIGSKYHGINSHHLETINILSEGEIVFAREDFIVKPMKNFETKNAETMSRTNYCQTEMVHPFCLPPLQTQIKLFFE